MKKNGHGDNAFQRADDWCKSVCGNYVLSLWSSASETRFGV